MRLVDYLRKNSFYAKNTEEGIGIWAAIPLILKMGDIRDAVIDFIEQYNKWGETIKILEKNLDKDGKIVNEEIYEDMKENINFLNKRYYDVMGITIWRNNKLEDFIVDNKLNRKWATNNISAIEIGNLLISLGWLCDYIGEFIGQFNARKSEFDAQEDMQKRYSETKRLLDLVWEVDIINNYVTGDMTPYFS